MKNTAYTFWFTGLSNSGKTTLTSALKERFSQNGIHNVKVLDGDEVRRRFNLNGYSEHERAAIGDAKIEMCRELNAAGYAVLVSGIAHRLKWRLEARKKIANYYEIFLDCSVETCATRDKKGVYTNRENVIGINTEYEVGSHDLIVNTERSNSEESVDIVYNTIVGMVS